MDEKTPSKFGQVTPGMQVYQAAVAVADKPGFPFATLALFLAITGIQFCINNSGPILLDKLNIQKVYQFGAFIYPYSFQQGEGFRLITACFVHYNWYHYSANLPFMLSFPFVERIIGWWRFLFLFLLSGLMAHAVDLSILYGFYIAQSPAVIILGASGPHP